MFNHLRSKLSEKNFPFFLTYFFTGISLFLIFKKNINSLIDPISFIKNNYFFLINFRFITSFLFFLYGYAAWVIPLSFLFLSFLFFLKETKVEKFFRIFGILELPFLFSFFCSIFSIRKNIIFIEGGIIGEFLSLFFIKNPLLILKIFFIQTFLFIFQLKGLALIKDLLILFLEETGLLSFLSFGKKFTISFFFHLFPFFRKFSKNKSDDFFEKCLKESLKEEINKISEMFEVKIEENNSIEKIPYKIIPVKNLKKIEKEDFFEEKSNEIISIAKSFEIDLKLIDFYKGPNVITSIFELSLTTRLSKLLSIEIEIGRHLGKPDLKIIYPVKNYPGHVGFQYSSNIKETINFMDYAHDEKFINFEGNIPFLFGIDTKGSLKIYDLTKMPHLLVAGSSGSGKSTFMHSCIMSIIWKYTPSYCKILLIDPKKIEYLFYSEAEHLIKNIAVNIDEIIESLNFLISEMNSRFDLFSKKKSKNITEYNLSTEENEKIPYIVTFIDEYADLVMQNKETESLILRLIQMGRAAGIHFIIATQRPSSDIINGAIKANTPFKVAFKTSSSIDSRIILGIDGAQNLLGNGDMLLINQSGEIERICGTYLSINEIETIISSISKKKVYDKIDF